ncbi:response regulator transcription factor [Candidatus Gracilibacteria bacterium]|nr:response regulator transcription factor [Candidatus Gracilibacteria bacterium]
MKLLIIEDHPKIRSNIIEYFTLKGYTIEGAIHGGEALDMLHTHYDIIILDMNMPIMDGRTFIGKLRKSGHETPVIVLTSNSLVEDKVTMFDLGADDYVVKPFEMRELEARIIALGRRRTQSIEEIIEFGEYRIDIGRKTIKKGDQQVELSHKEYGIIEYLTRNKSYPKSKMEILEAVWGMREAELAMNSVTLEAHISTIRKKLGKSIITTLKGTGYYIN